MEPELFHVLNRGVEKRTIVLDDKDRLRFVHDLYAFNDKRPTPNYILSGRHTESAREPLVHIHAFCLMHNHYHLLLSEAGENGISRFMHKFNMGYAKYFNEKYERSGVLWQGPSKKIRLVHDAHLMYIPYYIHLNPLDFKYPQWRMGGVKKPQQALDYLRAYRWSSHLDYSRIHNFPSITTSDLLRGILGNEKQYEKEIRAIITNPQLAAQSELIEN
jgi:putative transposase